MKHLHRGTIIDNSVSTIEGQREIISGIAKKTICKTDDNYIKLKYIERIQISN